MSYRILLASLFLVGCAHRGPQRMVHVDRLAELDNKHGFQDLTFNTRCTLERDILDQPGDNGLELGRTHRTVRVAPGAEGTLVIGCYKGLLGQATVELSDKRAVTRTRETLVQLYGAPDTTTKDRLSATWVGERVVLNMTLSADGATATVTYESKLAEALWRRDQLLAERRANPLPERSDTLSVFRPDPDGVF